MDTSWTQSLEQTTSIAGLKRYADVTYDSRNLSILDVKFGPHYESITYSPDDFQHMFRTILTERPSNSTTPSQDSDTVSTTLSSLGWALRLYTEVFPSNVRSPTEILQDMLLVPILFSTAAWQLTNVTYQNKSSSGAYALPADLETTVSKANRTSRVLAIPWSVDAFVAITSGLLVYSFAVLLWIWACKGNLPNRSGFMELDFASKVRDAAARVPESGAGGVRAYETFLWDGGLSNAKSGTLTEANKGRSIRVVGVKDGEGNRRIGLFIAESREAFNDVGLLEAGEKYL